MPRDSKEGVQKFSKIPVISQESDKDERRGICIGPLLKNDILGKDSAKSSHRALSNSDF